jgi:hypothetical protein
MIDEGVIMSDAIRFFQQLTESLQLLSIDSSTEMNALPKFVVVPDEIALIFHEIVLLLDQIFDAGLLKAEDVRRLVESDKLIHPASQPEGS